MAVGGQVLKTGESRRSYSRQAGILFLSHPAIKNDGRKKPQLSGAVSAFAVRVFSTWSGHHTLLITFVNNFAFYRCTWWHQFVAVAFLDAMDVP